MGIGRRIDVGCRTAAGRCAVFQRCRSIGEDDASLVAGIALARTVGLEAQLQIVGRGEIDDRTRRGLVQVVQVAVVVDVADIAVMIGLLHGDPRRDLVGQRPGDRGAGPNRVVVAIGQLSRAGEAVGRRLGDDVDHAAGGVAAVERTLRPFQHLDAVDIHQLLGRIDRPRQIDAVDIDGDRRVGADIQLVAANAADIRLADHRVGGELQAGSELGQLRRALNPANLQCIAGEGGDRQRNLLQILRPPFGGDRDLLESPICRAGIGGGIRGGLSRSVRRPAGRHQAKRDSAGQEKPGDARIADAVHEGPRCWFVITPSNCHTRA